MAHKWADWLHHPCRMGGPQRFRARDKIRSGPHVDGLATSLMPYGRSPTPEKGGENHKWPTNGRIGYITPAAWGVPNALERETKSEVAHKCADWLHHPCRMGGPQRLRRGGKITIGPQMADWLHHPSRRGLPNTLGRGTNSEVAHKWTDWLRHPCRMGGQQRFRAGD